MKRLFFWLMAQLLIVLPSVAQIAAVKAADGSANPQIKEVIIAYTMHYDIGYTDLSEAVLNKYKTSMIDEALRSVKKTSSLPVSQQFIWSTPGWPLKYILDNCTPERKAGLENAIKTKRFSLQALAFAMQTESSDLENLVRSMQYSTDLSRAFNVPLPREAKMSDVPEHSWLLPTVLANAGVKILHLGCNPGSISPDVPRLFWWEGPDNARLLTFYWDQYYGSGLMPPEDWKYKTWMAMISTHENTGPPKPEDVAKTLAEAKLKFPGAKVRIGTMTDFYNAIMKENPVIPVIRGDMPDTWIHGFMSMPRQVKTDKKYQRTLYATEALHTLERLWKLKTDMISDVVSKVTEEMNLFEEHTFGLAISHGAGSDFTYGDDFILNRAMGNYDRAEISWREKAAHMEEVERKGAMLETNTLKALAASTAVDGKRVVVYNCLPWARSGSVKLFLSIYKKDKMVTALKDTRTNKLIPVYNKGNLLQFYATEIPAMGYSTYIPIFDGETLAPDNGLRLDEAGKSIENKFLSIKFNADKGTIVSCLDKKTGKEMVDTDSPYGMGEYFHEYFGENELKRYTAAYVKPAAHGWGDDEMGRPMKNFTFAYEQTHPQKGRWVFQKNNDEIVATYFGELAVHYPHRYTVSYTIRPQTPYIELQWYMENKQAEANPEAGWIALPFKVTQPSFHLARPGGITDTSKDFVPRTNHDYFFLNTGLAVTDPNGVGVGLNTPDAPGVSLGRPGLYRFSKNFVPKKSTVFVNLYNTQWGTNFTEWIEGSWSAKLYLWPIEHYESQSSLITPMEQTRQQLTACYIDGSAGQLPLTKQGISLSKKGVLVTSFAGVKQSNKYRLRLWEMTGQAGSCEITLPEGHFTKAALVNLRDEPIADKKVLSIKNNKLTVYLGANQPMTLLLE